MTNHQSRQSVPSERRRLAKTLILILLACALALGVWALVQSMGRAATPETPALAGATIDSVSPRPQASTAPATAGTQSAPPTAKATAKPTPSAAPKTPPQAAPSAPPVGKDAALAAVPQKVAPPVPLNKAVSVQLGVGLSVNTIEAVDGQAQGIGEIAGPAIRFNATVTNSSGAELPAASISVLVEYGKDNTPAAELSGPGKTEFPSVIAKGQSATATFVFNVPVEQRDQVRILISLNASSPIAAFEGAVPVSKGTP